MSTCISIQDCVPKGHILIHTYTFCIYTLLVIAIYIQDQKLMIPQMYRSSSSNNIDTPANAFLNHREDHCDDDASRDRNNTTAASDIINTSYYDVPRRGIHHMSPPYQIPSIEEVYTSWERSRGLMSWNSSMLITAEKALGWAYHADGQMCQTVAGCDLTLSIGGRREDESEASSDVDGSSTTTEETVTLAMDRGAGDDRRSALNIDLNLDLALSSSWLA
uniref:Uncharacterized protein n=1 Tax=Avena sativa TaxID=4498 RepID=A0ACD5Z7Q7_AVESA